MEKLNSVAGSYAVASLARASRAKTSAHHLERTARLILSGRCLINDGDGDAPGGTSYHEYDGATGAQVTGGLAINLADFGFVAGTGVALAPNGQSLYFAADIGQDFGQTIVQFDLAGNPMSFQPISSRRLEDIDVTAP